MVPIWRNEREEAQIRQAVEELTAGLGDIRWKLDDREEYTPGWKFNEWEQRGVPLRMEIGPQDVKKRQVILARRDTGEKSPVAQEGLRERVESMLEEIQRNLFQRALEFREKNSYRVDDYGEFKAILEEKGGFLWAHWCGSADCEAKIQEETKATLRIIPFNGGEEEGRCVYCGTKSERRVLFARAY
jgi:prolyl-tRNA synthetase